MFNCKSPSLYVPTLYFIEGLPNALVALSSAVLFQNLGCSIEFIGQATTILTLPWMLKFAWAPLVDMYGKKRQWILVAHTVLAFIALSLAIAVQQASEKSPLWLIYLLASIMAIMAIASATQDIAMDGFYIECLDKEQQSFFVGVRNAAYRLAMLFGQGFLVFLAGYLSHNFGIGTGWSVSFLISSFIFILAFFLHRRILPIASKSDKSKSGVVEETVETAQKIRFIEVFSTFFDRPRLLPILAFVLLFRLGDTLMLKMATPFLLAKVNAGGLGISTETVGLIYGGVGVALLFCGGIVGGYLVSKFGLKRTLLPAALVQNAAIVLYYVMAVIKPGVVVVAVFNGFEQFAYGIGLSAYTVFLLSLASDRFRSGHYAIATALMALGGLIPGYFSGSLCTYLGFEKYFLFSFCLSIPGMIAIPFLPMATERERSA
ncbi:MAG: MFS transporter [Candidatus Obscuribacterales bacterium]|nr:MFS transporter [Candidatus Obscuribacterales bacterium]